MFNDYLFHLEGGDNPDDTIEDVYEGEEDDTEEDEDEEEIEDDEVEPVQ